MLPVRVTSLRQTARTATHAALPTNSLRCTRGLPAMRVARVWASAALYPEGLRGRPVCRARCQPLCFRSRVTVVAPFECARNCARTPTLLSLYLYFDPLFHTQMSYAFPCYIFSAQCCTSTSSAPTHNLIKCPVYGRRETVSENILKLLVERREYRKDVALQRWNDGRSRWIAFHTIAGYSLMLPPVIETARAQVSARCSDHSSRQLDFAYDFFGGFSRYVCLFGITGPVGHDLFTFARISGAFFIPCCLPNT